MSRSVALLLLAAAVATAAALGADGLEEVAASTATDTDAQPAQPLEPEPGPSSAPAAAPAHERPSGGTAGQDLSPSAEVPPRGRDISAAPEPAPRPTADWDSRHMAGIGELLAASGTSRDPVDRGGTTVRFSVEVEAATGLDPDAVAADVEEALYDERSWARSHDLRRVAPGDASIHVVIGTPEAIDTLCARAGLRTMGWLSCWSGDTAAINLERWTEGVAHYDDLAQYRRYVVNHEVGHGLGHDHRGCPGRGRLAPLMQQQTKSLDGCVANEWRHPDA